MAVKDFTEDMIKARVEARQKAREEARKQAKTVVNIRRFEDGKLFIDVLDEDVHPVQLMLGLVSQHIEMLETTISEIVQERNELAAALQELQGTGVARASMTLPDGPLQ